MLSSRRKIENKITCQVLRSASNWSVGLDKKDENSILRAYYSLIDNAQHYIMIENQFFISKSFTDEEHEMSSHSTSSSIVNEYLIYLNNLYNRIALRIRKRIERAYEEKQKFRVFIFIPLLPGFEGEINDSITLQIILKYTYKSISRNRGLSLIEKLYQLMQDKYEDYIHFFSLRSHGLVNDIPRTELVYIHSKLMIVDDKICLIGSANINDRSMLGSRDSEIAIIMKEEEGMCVPSKMDGQHYLASHFAQSLRIRLMKEHMGYSNLNNPDYVPDILLDPLDDKLFKMMKQIAKSNSFYYREIFNCYPDDKFAKFSDIIFYKQYDEEQEKFLRQKYESNKNKIIGNIVDFPLNFLKEETLQRSYFCKEILVPIKNFL
jgi:phospholipase D1/2